MGEVRLSRLIGRMVANLSRRGEGDAELLDRFVTRQDEAAFEALVRRHGPMVLGICRGVLGHEQDAEDAFQATFLVLARKAASVRLPGRLGHWLQGVAYRTARHARRSAANRRAREALAVPREQETDDVSELREVLDQGLLDLPQAYREVIVLCDLEGKARREVAGLLGCPEGTVASRLARAREALAKRLEKHGLAVSGPLAAATAKGAVAFAAGREAAGAVPARVVALAAEVLGIMASTRLTRAALLLLVAVLAAGVGALSASNATRQERRPAVKEAKAAPPGRPEGKAKADEDLKKLQGTWVMDSNRSSKSAGVIWVIAGEKITQSQAGDLSVEGRLKIDPAKRPKTIEVSLPGHTPVPIQGTYELEGNTLKVSVSSRSPGGPASWVFKRLGVSTAFAYDVVETYHGNLARGEENYTGRQVTVTGEVECVKEGKGDGYSLLMPERRRQTTLVFYFEKDARKQLAKLDPGQVVTVQGQCRGRGKVEGVKAAILFDKAKIVTLPD